MFYFAHIEFKHPVDTILIIGIGYTVVVSHEVIQMQKYNEELCINDPDYKLDKCRFDHIKKVGLNIIIFDIA